MQIFECSRELEHNVDKNHVDLTRFSNSLHLHLKHWWGYHMGRTIVVVFEPVFLCSSHIHGAMALPSNAYVNLKWKHVSLWWRECKKWLWLHTEFFQQELFLSFSPFFSSHILKFRPCKLSILTELLFFYAFFLNGLDPFFSVSLLTFAKQGATSSFSYYHYKLLCYEYEKFSLKFPELSA